jgi:methylated-DNA-[protein]-cysteine S-methyltransferase
VDQELSCLSIDSPIGPIAVYAQGQFIVKVELNKRCRPIGNSTVLAEAERQIREYFARNRKSFDLKTKVQGTTFQKDVWQRIAKLKAGEQTSYGEIAKAIGRPKASRAVGAAVGANPVPLIVGCHRVLGVSGALTGFSGGKGLVTKKWLLNHEKIDYQK